MVVVPISIMINPTNPAFMKIILVRIPNVVLFKRLKKEINLEQ